MNIDDVLAGGDIEAEVGISNFTFYGGLSWSVGIEAYDILGGGASITIHLDKIAEAFGIIPKDRQCNQVQ